MLFNLVIVGFLVLLPGANPAESAGIDMRCAAKNSSTAPSYVLVTVTNAKSHESFISAVESGNLQYALGLEHQLGHALARQDISAYQAIYKLIDEHPDLVFEFSFEPAIERLRPRYTEVKLNEVRRTLLNLNDEAILKGFGQNGDLYRLIETFGQPAIAHVLLERGFAAGRGDYVPIFIVSKPFQGLKCGSQ